MAEGEATKPGDGAVAATGSALGLIFKPFEHLWRAIPRSVQYFLIGALVLLVIYPLIAFAAVVHLIQYLPDRIRLPLQERALESWGLERVYSSTSELNSLNKAVDTSTLWKIPSDAQDEYNESLMPGQRVLLRATIQQQPKENSAPECVAAAALPRNAELGDFTLSLDDVDWRKTRPLKASEGKLQTIVSIDREDWAELYKKDLTEVLPLSIAYYPKAAGSNMFLQCFRYQISAYIVVYKPELGAAGRQARAGSGS
ncbi:MAG TPA: hypothetical protein VF759_13300 [Allosphingosinicella sp.]|jgi:hypothetical protein